MSSKIRIDWVRLTRPEFTRGAAANDVAGFYGQQTLTVGSTAVTSNAVPAFGSGEDPACVEGFARITVIQGAVIVAWGAAPVATETSGIRLQAGDDRLIAVASGQFMSFIEAADGASGSNLPAGAATSANQASEIATLSSIDSKVTGLATATNQTSANASLASMDGKLTGVATASNQASANTSLASIDGKVTGLGTAANQASVITSLASVDSKLTGVSTAASQATTNTSLSSIDSKVTGVATAANQATANGSLSSIDSKLTTPLSVRTAVAQAVATARSATITAGGTAQDLMPANSSRIGWLLQNQSTGPLYVRSKGSGGTTTATTDQNSLLIPAGGYYEPPKITVNALSIVGATTGQAFFAEEW